MSRGNPAAPSHRLSALLSPVKPPVSDVFDQFKDVRIYLVLRVFQPQWMSGASSSQTAAAAQKTPSAASGATTKSAFLPPATAPP